MQTYGKFDSAEALYKAYCALERKFTQKCQELKALQSGINDPASPPQVWTAEEALGKLEALGQDEAFCNAHPLFRRALPLIKHNLLGNSEALGEDALMEAYRAAAETFVLPEEVAEDEAFLENYVFGRPEVLEQATIRYLMRERPKSPRVIGRGGHAEPTPPYRPKTFADAAKLAERYFD